MTIKNDVLSGAETHSEWYMVQHNLNKERLEVYILMEVSKRERLCD